MLGDPLETHHPQSLVTRPELCVCVVCVCVFRTLPADAWWHAAGLQRVAVVVAKHGGHIAWLPTISEGHGINSLIMPYRDQLTGVGVKPTDVTQLELVVSRKVTNSHDSHLKKCPCYLYTLSGALVRRL